MRKTQLPKRQEVPYELMRVADKGGRVLHVRTLADAVAVIAAGRANAAAEGWAGTIGDEPADGRVLAVFGANHVTLWWSVPMPRDDPPDQGQAR